MTDFTLITGEVTAVDAVIDDDDQVWLDPADVEAVTGWAAKPIGLCREELCIPTHLHPGLVGDDGRLALDRFATAIGAVVVVDATQGVAVLGESAATHAERLRSGRAPDFTLPDLDGTPVSLEEFRGQKTLVVAFASWCGCRHDLPAWQELHDELRDDGFGVVAIAIDEDPEEVRPFVDGTEYPVLIDRDRQFADSYSLTNVPTVIWVDEDGRIARPHGVAFGSDMFKEFHNVDSSPHHDALRRWVRDGELPTADEGEPLDALVDPTWTPTEDEQLAHLHYRLALHLWRDGREDAAIGHFDAASALAPLDFTVRRAQLPLRGKDPFLGEEFLELYEEWESAGSPYYGATPAAGASGS